jgi:hypothetical protein
MCVDSNEDGYGFIFRHLDVAEPYPKTLDSYRLKIRNLGTTLPYGLTDALMQDKSK